MATMLEKLRAKRENGEISTASAAVKIAGEGHYTVKVTEAKWDKNRDGTAEQGKITFKVIAVRKDTDPSEVGGIFSEYVSLKNEEMAEKKYLQISDWMSNGGIKDEKMVDEDDEDLNDSMRTLILALQKYCQKREKHQCKFFHKLIVFFVNNKDNFRKSCSYRWNHSRSRCTCAITRRKLPPHIF